MNKNVVIAMITLLVVISCEVPSKDIEKQESAIYSLLIDRMAKPFPPPPPRPRDGSEPKPINFDSIRKVQVEMVVDPMMFHISKTVDIDKEYSHYQNLVNSISSLPAKPVKTEYINSEEGHTLIFGNSLEDSQDQYSQMVSISRIAFNEKKNKAALFAGHSTHPLAGYLNLYLLEKINGRWKIVYEKTVEVS